METLTLHSRDLSFDHRCRRRRLKNITFKRGKEFKRMAETSGVVKQVIKDSLLNGFDPDEAGEKISKTFHDSNYETGKTADAYAEEALALVKRYLSSEKRHPEIPEKAETVEPFGMFKVLVKPDLIFRGTREFTRTVKEGGKKIKVTYEEPYVEVVKLCYSKPSVTQTGKKKDTGVNQSLELYSMLLYARERIGNNPDINVGASYYYLKRKDDSREKLEPDFFKEKGGGNVVGLWEYHSLEAMDTDDLFYPQFADFMEGEEIHDEEICKRCDFYTACYYSKPPVPAEKKASAALAVPISAVRLTKQQQEAVAFRKGVARINAGAGAGKTLVIALRVANLLKEGVRPEQICLLTFTNTGAEEMSRRIVDYVDQMGLNVDAGRVVSTTFNSFGYNIVRHNYRKFGFTEPPVLIDEIRRAQVISKILDEGEAVPGLDYKNFSLNTRYAQGALPVVKKCFEVIKQNRLSENEDDILAAMIERKVPCILDKAACSAILKLYQKYCQELQAMNMIEYADQELLTMDLLESEPDYFNRYAFRHIIVDEFQDSNEIQFRLLQKLTSIPEFESFMIVGDDSQSIFGFRGTTPDYIVKFFEKLGGTGKDFFLLDNHRSTPEIIDFANRINLKNTNRVEKDLIPTRTHGKSVRVVQFANSQEESAWILSAIKKRHEEGIPYEDMAYIASTRGELERMKKACEQADIPCIMLNPEILLENPGIRAATSLARHITDPEDEKSLFVYLNTVLDNLFLIRDEETIREIMQDTQSYIDMVVSLDEPDALRFFKEMLDILGNDEIFVRFREKLFAKNDFRSALQYAVDFLRYGENQTEKRTASYPGIVLTTAHSSKGMEWPIVFDAVSHYHTKDLDDNPDPGVLDEKYRLFFVSATRARDELYITGQGVAYGPKDRRVYNRFLMDACSILGEEFIAV